MKKIGKGYDLTKDGKLVAKPTFRSASEAIRQRKSKRQRVVSPAKARMASKAQRP